MSPFRPPHAVARLLRGLEVLWFVAGGWAIDLYLGRETRPHEDIEVAILRKDQDSFRRHLLGWEFEKVVSGRRTLWREGETLNMPVHEVHAKGGREPREFEVLLNESDGGLWKFRRDSRVTLPIAKIGDRSDIGIPHLRPEVVLLYKAKRPRDRDEADFAVTRPALSASSRDWLRRALDTAHPQHPWIRDL